ncbi:MAG: class I SAM-dependent rRNA methyltransferase [Pseudomonadota bacterium]|nr:class I SAM-dependent rRNA methyltransferase [Pseudomonadota bacterium]
MIPLRLKKGREEAIRGGYPWIYAGDIIESSELLLLPPGGLVAIETHRGEAIGTGYYNARSQIACRVLALGQEKIDLAFLTSRIEKALAQRQRLIGAPYCRLIHSEADGLPGLLVDRFGDILVAQAGTAGMEQLQPLWMRALEDLLHPQAILLRNDTTARKLEGLKQEVIAARGNIPSLVEVQENGCIYLADVMHGQKTGWFYDQRDNRRMIAELAKGKTVLDVYAHSGGFGLLAAKYGAAQVALADSSRLALDLAAQAAVRNHLASLHYMQGDAFETMERLAGEKQQFDIVLADPPAFVKSRKDIAAGLKGYEKVTRLAAALVLPGGLLFVASCSHYASRSSFDKAVQDGIAKAGREGAILKRTGAAPDHPCHPRLPQSEYLKGILLRLV